jgi:4'-phosphopantetheinyl transferase
MTLFPVVMPVVDPSHKLSGKEEVDYLSRVAREALGISARKSNVELGELLKDDKGVPCPAGGTYWSLSHKPRYVAAVVSRDKVGIDIEEVRPRTELLFARVACEDEWQLQDRSWNTLFRYWTAKEAVLKVIGVGIGGLRTCRITSVPDKSHLTLDYRGQFFLVEQLVYDGHLVSVIRNDNQVEWLIASKSETRNLKL